MKKSKQRRVGLNFQRGTDHVSFRSDEIAQSVPASIKLNLTPMSDLDLMIANGWGNTAQRNLPADWRTRINPRSRKVVQPSTVFQSGAASSMLES